MTNDNFAFSSFLDNLQSFNEKRPKYFELYLNQIRFEMDLPVYFSINFFIYVLRSRQELVWKDEIPDAGWKKINSDESFLDLHAIHYY